MCNFRPPELFGLRPALTPSQPKTRGPAIVDVMTHIAVDQLSVSVGLALILVQIDPTRA